jgi:hypothetical protein
MGVLKLARPDADPGRRRTERRRRGVVVSLRLVDEALGVSAFLSESGEVAQPNFLANCQRWLVLRESRRTRHPGGGTIGVKVLGFEVALLEELDQVENRLVARRTSVRRLRRDSYETVIGVDPDNYAIAISAGSTGRPTQRAEWSDPDEIIEAMAQ